MLSYWNIPCVSMITCIYRRGSSILPLQIQDTLFLDILLFSVIAFWCLVTWLRCDFFILCLNDFWHIIYEIVADFNSIPVDVLWRLWLLEKDFVTNWGNVFEWFVQTDLLGFRLNDIMFRFHVFGFSDLVLVYFKSLL